MLIEAKQEELIKNVLAVALSADACEIVGSWQPADVGSFKGEHDKSSKAVVSLYIQPRSHDAFSLPTITLNGTVAIDCRVEQCPTMSEVGEIYEKVMKVFDDWHYNAESFSTALSTSDFFATEIMLSGGTKITYNSQLGVWTVTLSFAIKGTVNHDLTS